MHRYLWLLPGLACFLACFKASFSLAITANQSCVDYKQMFQNLERFAHNGLGTHNLTPRKQEDIDSTDYCGTSWRTLDNKTLH